LKASDLLTSAPSSSGSDLGKRRRDEPQSKAGFKPVAESNGDEQQAANVKEAEDMDLDSDTEDRRMDILDIDDVPRNLLAFISMSGFINLFL